MMQANDAYAREGLRVLAVAQRTVPKGAANYEPEQIENELVLIGLVAMMDPARRKWRKRSKNATAPASAS